MGWGGIWGDVNVHVTLMMLRCLRGLGWGGVGWDVNVHVTQCIDRKWQSLRKNTQGAVQQCLSHKLGQRKHVEEAG